MPGFASSVSNSLDVVFAANVDFSKVSNSDPQHTITTNGQLLIGTTAVNIGGTHINVGIITSPNSTISVGYSTPNITLQAGTMIATTYTGNTGVAVPAANNLNILGATVAAGTSPLVTAASGSTVTINAQRSQALASADATKVGLANFNSTDFTVDANGFVSLTATNLTVAGQTFTSTGAFTYTPTTGMKYVIVELQGAGGGGGGVDAAVGNVAVAGGGGSGGYARFILTAAQVGASLSGSVGALGAGGAAGNNAGATGGNTTLATTAAWTVGGGAGGAGGATSATVTTSVGGAGGTNTTGTGTILINKNGGGGASGWTTLTIAMGGEGSSSFYGNGGFYAPIVDSSSQDGNAAPATSFGGGGGGAAGINTNTDRAGGTGRNGIAIFTEFIFV